MKGLLLSLFPGLGLLDLAFEMEGWCVVRAPDLLWGGDIRRFNVPAGRFDGVIGGPPCKRFSTLSNIVRARWGEDSLAPDQIPEFVRIVEQSKPSWFLMENVERAPLPTITGYEVHSQLLNNRWCGGVQNRLRRFSFGARELTPLVVHHQPEPEEYRHAVTAGAGGRRRVPKLLPNGRIVGKQGSADDARLANRPIEEMAADQGLNSDWIAALRKTGAFKATALRTGIGNGVPLPMGRAVAQAVYDAVGRT